MHLVDTNAAVFVAPEAAVLSLLDGVGRRSDVQLKTYTGEQTPVKGCLTVDVTYGQQHVKNLVVQASGLSIMGKS